MPWSSVDEFLSSETYKRVSAMHGWSKAKLQKFVSAFNAVYQRTVRNGADAKKAESLAFPVAFDIARRAASEETVSKAEKSVHYFAAHVPQMAGRSEGGTDVTGREFKFTLVEKSLPLLRELVAGLAFNADHTHGDQQGVIVDIIPVSEAPPEVQAATDVDVPFLYVAAYRNDVTAEMRAETRISPEWLILDGDEVLPMTFATTHSPLNQEETGIRRVASELLYEEAATLDAQKRDKLHGESFACPAERKLPIHDAAHVRAALARFDQTDFGTCPKSAAMARIREAAKKFGVEMAPAAAKATSYQPNSGYDASGSSMADKPDLEAQVASLTASLDDEKKARGEAETKAKATEVVVAAQKAEVELLRKRLDDMVASAIEAEAEGAFLRLVESGQATSDKAPYWTGLYKKLGKEQFTALVANLPKVTLGVNRGSKVGAPPEASFAAEQLEGVRKGAVDLMRAEAAQRGGKVVA